WRSKMRWRIGKGSCGGRFRFAESSEDFLRRNGNAADARADRVRHGVGNGRRSGNGNRFANANHAALRHVEKYEINFRNVRNTRQLVGFEIRVEHDARHTVHHAPFVKSVTDSHDDAAIDLAFGGEFADDQSPVLNANNLLQLHKPGVGVDLDFGKLNSSRAARGQAL